MICTHVIEHILDYRAAIAELRRIAKQRLIIVVPREREGIYTFNPHFNFFPVQRTAFLRAMIPVPRTILMRIDVGRDIYYSEKIADGGEQPPRLPRNDARLLTAMTGLEGARPPAIGSMRERARL